MSGLFARASRCCLAALVLSLPGCVSGPSYAGGPTDEQPHGRVIPGPDVSVWRVDGYDTVSRGGVLLLEPGLRRLKVRLEYPIDSESATPFDYVDVSLRVEQGHIYRLDRSEGEYPPYEVVIKESARRE